MRSFLFKRGFILPVTVTGLIPITIVLVTEVWRSIAAPWVGLGAVLYGTGMFLLITTTHLFARHDGSLAPWNPPARFVALGPYRYCRNPMISGIYAMLAGEAIAFQSIWLGAWGMAFVAGMTSHIVFQEEPLLRARFGESYDTYRMHVPRWLPRLTPYELPK